MPVDVVGHLDARVTCGHAVPFRSQLGPSLGRSLALAAVDPSPASGSLAIPRSEDRLAARRPSARDGAAPASHPPPVQRRGNRPSRVALERGENGEPMSGHSVAGRYPEQPTAS